MQRKIEFRNSLDDKSNKQSLTLFRDGRIHIREFVWNTVLVFWKPKILAFIDYILAIYAHSQTRCRFTDAVSGKAILVLNMTYLLLFSLNLRPFWGCHQVLFSCFLVVWIGSCKDLERCQITQVTDCTFCHRFCTSSRKLSILLLNVVRFALSSVVIVL